MTALVIIEAVAIGLLGVLVAGLLRSHAEILRRLHELGAGLDDGAPAGPLPIAAPTTARPASDVAGFTPGDEAIAVSVVGTGHDTLLAFLSSGCATCERLFRDEPRLPERTRLVVITKSPVDESVSAIRDLTRPGTTVVMSTDAWQQYGVPGSPYFVLVDGPSGRVRGEGASTSWQQASGLIAQALADAKTGRAREARADAELLAAGIQPGHESLYQ